MTLYEKRKVLLEYLKMKVFDEDWHGASDAANDLREIDAALKFHFKDPFPKPDVKQGVSVSAPETAHFSNAEPEFNKENTDRIQKLIDALKMKDEELVNTIFPAGAI